MTFIKRPSRNQDILGILGTRVAIIRSTVSTYDGPKTEELNTTGLQGSDTRAHRQGTPPKMFKKIAFLYQFARMKQASICNKILLESLTVS